MLTSEDIGLVIWSPLAGGFHSGKFDPEGQTAEGRRVTFDFPPIDKERTYDAIEVMRTIAAGKGCTVPQVAVAWLLHQPVVTSVILGARCVDQLTDTLGAVEIAMSDDELAAFDAVTQLPQEYPGWMIDRQSTNRV